MDYWPPSGTSDSCISWDQTMSGNGIGNIDNRGHIWNHIGPQLPRRTLAHIKQSAEGYKDSDNPCHKQTDIRKIFRRKQAREIAWRRTLDPLALVIGCFLISRTDYCDRCSLRFWLLNVFGISFLDIGLGVFFLPIHWQDECQQSNEHKILHSSKIVPRVAHV